MYTLYKVAVSLCWSIKLGLTQHIQADIPLFVCLFAAAATVSENPNRLKARCALLNNTVQGVLHLRLKKRDVNFTSTQDLVMRNTTTLKV